MNKELNRKYAELIVKSGVNLQKNQGLLVTASIDAIELIREIVEVAYEAGASNVIVDYTDKAITRSKIKYASEESFHIQDYQINRMHYLVDNNYAKIYICCDDPDELAGLDLAKFYKARVHNAPLTKFYSDFYGNSVGQWCVCGYPEKNWAKLVFPDLTEDEAYEKLYNAILDASHVRSDNDPIQEWDELDKAMMKRNDVLNAYQFESLHFKNELGTDLHIGLVDNHIWAGGGEYSTSGIYFNPNIPTEENFCMPHNKHIDGIVYATKPLSCGGRLVKDFWIKFKDGKVVDYDAKENKDALKEVIEFDDKSNSLGEVAIVPFYSPISLSNILYYETLYDENASCHLALGCAYVTTNLKDGLSYSEEELDKLGCNISNTHVDFMFGSRDMTIMGIKKDKTEVVIFKDGRFVI